MNLDSLISLEQITVNFSPPRSFFARTKHTALKRISFELNRGDSLGVVGRNGAGKSTLLRLLAGIIAPDHGRIINRSATTSLLSLQAGFDPRLSGRINAVLSGIMLGFSRQEVEAGLERIIDFSELGSFIDKPVNAYSAGMRARLGFSVALELNPEVLLIDEILGVGDHRFRKKSMNVMREKLLSMQTIVFVSHDGASVRNLCNRAIWLENGILKMDGPADEVVSAYEYDGQD